MMGKDWTSFPNPLPTSTPLPSENSGGNRSWVSLKARLWVKVDLMPVSSPSPSTPSWSPKEHRWEGFPGTQPSRLCRCARKGVHTPQQWEEAQAMESSILSFVDIFSVTRTSSWVLQFYVRPWNICIHIVFNVTFITFLRFRYSSIRLYRKKKAAIFFVLYLCGFNLWKPSGLPFFPFCSLQETSYALY